jgi:hypothetical protein
VARTAFFLVLRRRRSAHSCAAAATVILVAIVGIFAALAPHIPPVALVAIVVCHGGAKAACGEREQQDGFEEKGQWQHEKSPRQ